MKKLLSLIALISASLALAGTAGAATTPTNFRVTQAVPVSDIIGGQGEIFVGSTIGAFPIVGKATMDVDSFFSYQFDGTFFSGFSVTFTTARGDRLTLFSGIVPDTTF